YSSTSGVVSGSTVQGTGWLNNNENVYLIREDSNNIRVLLSASSSFLFTSSGSAYTAPADYDATLTKISQVDAKDYDQDTNTSETFNVFVLRELSTSRVYIFAGFDAGVAAGYQGRLVELTSAHWVDQSGLTGFKYTYSSGGELQQITSPTGQEYSIVFTH